MSAAPARVSVLMPVRNGASFVRAALDSVLGQTLADLEVIIVDDGSTDTTPQILREYGDQDPRIRIVKRGGPGLPAALNRALTEARGEYVARMDADDISVPQRLERQLAYLEAEREFAVVGSALAIIGEAGAPINFVHRPSEPRDITHALRSRNCIAHPSVMARRKVLLALGGYRPNFPHAEDYDLWLRVADGHLLANLSEQLVCYRVHASQVTSLNLEQQTISSVAARCVAARRRHEGAEPPLPETADSEFLASLGVSTRDLAHELSRASLDWAAFIEPFDPCAAASLIAVTRVRVRELGGGTHPRLLLARRAVGLTLRRRVRAPVHPGARWRP
jgi:hypothetical protein